MNVFQKSLLAHKVFFSAKRCWRKFLINFLPMRNLYVCLTYGNYTTIKRTFSRSHIPTIDIYDKVKHTTFAYRIICEMWNDIPKKNRSHLSHNLLFFIFLCLFTAFFSAELLRTKKRIAVVAQLECMNVFETNHVILVNWKK